MKKKYPGNRRTSVPADRHKRAVAYRHVRYAVSRSEDKVLSAKKEKKSFFITADENDSFDREESGTDHVSETLSIPKIEPSQPETLKKAEKRNESEKRKEKEQKKSERQRKEKKEKVSRRERKKAEQEELLNELLDEPDISWKQILFDPAGCMDRVERVDHATMSMAACIFQMILKWLTIGFCIAAFTGKFVNQNPFGFAALSFKDLSAFAAKLGGFGFVAELVNYVITGLICSTSEKPLKKARLISIDTYGIPACVVLLVISLVLMELVTVLGVALFFATCILMLFLKGYALTKTGVKSSRHMLSVLICSLLFIVCGYFFAKFTCGNIWAILDDIMNI